jgi:hypothetical protein
MKHCNTKLQRNRLQYPDNENGNEPWLPWLELSSGLYQNVPALSSIRYLLPLRKYDIFATHRIRITQEEFYTFTHFTLKGLLPATVGKVTPVVCNNGKTKMIETYLKQK